VRYTQNFLVRSSSQASKLHVIEHDMDDFALLQTNLRQNDCTNVIAVNMTIAAAQAEIETIAFPERAYPFSLDSLPLYGISQEMRMLNTRKSFFPLAMKPKHVPQRGGIFFEFTSDD
jgi:hypothetical protein